MPAQNFVFQMKEMNVYQIPFTGLKEGKHNFEFNVKNTFFLHFGYEEFNSSNITVHLVLNKTATMMELTFAATGSVSINCDVTNEPFDQKIDSSLDLVVKFGSVFNDENDDLLILPHGEFEVAVQQYIYEMIVLSIPVKRVHPGIADGSLQSEMLTKIKEYSGENKKEEDQIDPRWNKLKNLLTDK